MNLSSRLAVFFAPVLLIGYVFLAFTTYVSQKDIAISQAQAQLDGMIELLQTELADNVSSLDNFLASMPKADEILSEEENKQSVEEELRLKSLYLGRSMSFTIFSEVDELLFRYRHQVEEEALPHQAVHRRILSNDQSSNWKLLDADSPSVILSSLREERTANIYSESEGSYDQNEYDQGDYELQVAVLTDHLDSTWNSIEQFYGAELQIEPNPISLEDRLLAASVSLSTGEHLNLLPDESYINTLLAPLLRAHIIGFLLLFLVTLLTLTLTVRRYIGSPLKLLSNDLTDLYGGKTSTLKGSKRSDEIGILARRFQNLHQELADTYEASRILAEYDPLTSLPNRSSFYIHAEETLRSAALYHQEIKLLYIDLDNYKQVNDKFGHDMGDELLVDFSRRLTRTLHNKFGDSTVFAARLAGDEFAVILPPDTKEMDVRKVCQDILDLFEGGYWFARGRFAVTLSIGVASYPDDGNNISELVSNADIAMYQAKAAGKNQTAAYSQDLAARSRYLDDLERELRRADFEQEFYLTYMPIYDDKKSVVSCEALLRWNSPQLGEVSPADFVPVAETCGLFVQLDRWVISNSFADFRRLRKCFGENFRLSINLSSAELQSNDILGFIKEQFSYYGIQPSAIELEMTETFAISQHLIDGGLLYKLAELGVHICLDDFGTGFTSMLQLVEYPIERIKLDRTFISRIINSNRQNLLPALVDLCHAQKLQVTAEGIENAQIAQTVLNANCDCLQGYYLCKPKRLSELEQLYRGYNKELA